MDSWRREIEGGKIVFDNLVGGGGGGWVGGEGGGGGWRQHGVVA